ncbi:hypothetical protein R1sor_010185 [Riccia sorocarpa]|uniref:Uncharacterized protein n=1 Tax=Riccia sorocarpa TaxID=122646 RepID=A0ABD3I3C6_9MARC
MAAQARAPLHFELYTKEDDVNYIRWKWISKKEAHRVLRGIDGRLLRRSGLHDALWMDWARPEEGTTSVREFVLNWDNRTQSSTVGGREIPLTIDTMREYFLLPEGLNPPRSARHYDELSDWVPERSRTAKTWYANDVYLPVWRPRTCGIVDDEEIVLSDSDKSVEDVTPPRSARAAPVHVQSSSSSPDRVQDPSSSSPEHVHVSSPNSPERGLDRGHLSPGPRDVPSSSSPGRTRQASPTSPNRQHSPESSPGGSHSTLSDHATRSGSPSSPDRGETADNEPLTGFGSPMVPYPASEDDEEGAIEGAIKGLTSLGATDLTTIAKGKRPVLHRSSSESEEIRFARPDRVKRRVAATEDEAGGPVSQQAEGSQGDDISYVEANWHQAQAQDPIACLANYWAPMDERDEDFLWSNCTAADRQKFMAELHGHRIQRAGQKAMQFAMAGADQPSQTQDGAGPCNSSQTAATEIGQPIVPAPLSAASLISDAEFLLAGCRDEDMELTRLHGAL